MKEITADILNHIGLKLIFDSSIGGGSIHQASRLIEPATGKSYFLKSNSADAAAMFEAEMRGLRLLKEASERQQSAMVVPEALASGKVANTAWLLMEYLPETRPSGEHWMDMGRALAQLHRDPPADFSYGLDHDNFIGSLPQHNTSRNQSWPEFFILNRLEPQYEHAINQGRMGALKAWSNLCSWVQENFPDGPPSLVHGDLWSGNAMFVNAPEGPKPAIFDPAVYVGHAEVDLAMTHLFGGFPPSFYQGYEETTPTIPGFQERLDVLNLYFVLVHVNLFGGGYVRQAERVIHRFD
ncbi:MAG: fructosamine kinase family protein [Bacteroidetes bacterium]|nr:fructosamine kinase family protein [Bacteroidota bacterium]MCH8524445.1 fructosamine kinase family protein [Balneolales bacterium]